jgi:hypothetical protein
MGITLTDCFLMHDIGLLKKGINILDIGSSNLYSADVNRLYLFIKNFKPVDNNNIELANIVKQLSDGSAYDSINGGLNEAWIGQLFELCGFKYRSFDISSMYNTTIFDINFQQLPLDLFLKFDLVCNCGTTEHIFNQYNAFNVIHNSCAIKGYMIHALPCAGYTDHGYFHYTTRFFLDLAMANNYKITYISKTKGHKSDLYSSERTNYYNLPILNSYQTINKVLIDDFNLYIAFQKINDEDFKIKKETSTTVFIPKNLTYMSNTILNRLLNRFKKFILRLKGLP